MQSEKKFSWQGKPEEVRPGDDDPSGKVMFGGCGVFYGPIRGPAAARTGKPRRAFWSLFGFGRKEKPLQDT